MKTNFISEDIYAYKSIEFQPKTIPKWFYTRRYTCVENQFKYFTQLALLNELLINETINQEEYDQINNYIKQKYRIQEILAS
jgi:hypothetical protein